MRYCIIAGPRSGSTWIEFLVLGHLKSKGMLPQRLGEFFHPHVANFEQFVLSEDNFIIPGIKHWPTDKETYEGRVSMILNSNIKQPLTMRLFPQDYSFNFIDYVDVAKKLQSRNFKFISLFRNIFDRAISWAVMDHTSIVHLIKENGKLQHTTYQGLQEKSTIDPIFICPDKFNNLLLNTQQDDNNRKTISNVVNAVEINYDTVEQDLQKLGIKLQQTHMQIVHDLPYSTLVKNYNQLEEIYHNLKNTT